MRLGLGMADPATYNVKLQYRDLITACQYIENQYQKSCLISWNSEGLLRINVDTAQH